LELTTCCFSLWHPESTRGQHRLGCTSTSGINLKLSTRLGNSTTTLVNLGMVARDWEYTSTIRINLGPVQLVPHSMKMGLGFCVLKTLRERLIKVVCSAFLLPGQDEIKILYNVPLVLVLTHFADRPGSWQRHTYPPTSVSYSSPPLPCILLLVEL
jgi:hypothetical protein